MRAVRLDALIAAVERSAERCLSGEPAVDHVRELARASLDLVQRLREGARPYRDAPSEPEEISALAALERELDACKDKLARAEAALKRR